MKSLIIISGIIFAIISQSDAHLIRLGQRHIYPMTEDEFVTGGHSGDDTKLVMVQRMGDLIKWMETIQDIPVYGSVITTRSDANGIIYRVQGYSGAPYAKVDPTPNISGKEAIDILKIHWGHEGLKNVDFRLHHPVLNVLQKDESKLVWIVSYDVDWNDGVDPKEGVAVPAEIKGLVNAHTGRIEQTWDNRQEATVKAISGNNKIGVSEMDIDVVKENYMCYHVDEDRRVKAYTMDNKRYLSKATTTSFICDRADTQEWDLYNYTGGYSPRNDAFEHGVMFVDMWRKLIPDSPPPYRTNTSSLDFYIHYGYQIGNAAFTQYFFLIGDGNEKFYPFTSLDVICHEIGHAITLWRGGKMEYWKESGGINEAYSDMLGETCDMYYKNKTDYLIGEEIMKPGQPVAMRDMCNPKRLGGLDHYSQYKPGIDVHNSSGIYNKAWCTLSKTPGWDYVKAFQVFTRANLMMWNAKTTMHCGACDVEDATRDLELSVQDVSNAFKAVGVFCDDCKKSLLAALNM